MSQNVSERTSPPCAVLGGYSRTTATSAFHAYLVGDRTKTPAVCSKRRLKEKETIGDIYASVNCCTTFILCVIYTFKYVFGAVWHPLC